jgi:hypothetical protein
LDLLQVLISQSGIGTDKMTDITKCNNKECPMKEKCYRHTAKDGFFQSYCYFSPESKTLCHHFYPNQLEYDDEEL